METTVNTTAEGRPDFISIRDFSFFYGKKQALFDISLDIPERQVTAFIGPSGCGKSTLTRAILGLEPVQAGTITLNGAPVWAGSRPNREVRRNIQVVFQDPYGSFNPRHKVARLITEPYHLLDAPLSEQDRKSAVSEALEAVGLVAGDGDKYPHEFSGGQRQRLAMKEAFGTDAAGLDEQWRRMPQTTVARR